MFFLGDDKIDFSDVKNNLLILPTKIRNPMNAILKQFYEKIKKKKNNNNNNNNIWSAIQFNGGVYGGFELLGKNLSILSEYFVRKINFKFEKILVLCYYPECFLYFFKKSRNPLNAGGQEHLESDSWKVCAF